MMENDHTRGPKNLHSRFTKTHESFKKFQILTVRHCCSQNVRQRLLDDQRVHLSLKIGTLYIRFVQGFKQFLELVCFQGRLLLQLGVQENRDGLPFGGRDHRFIHYRGVFGLDVGFNGITVIFRNESCEFRFCLMARIRIMSRLASDTLRLDLLGLGRPHGSERLKKSSKSEF